VSWRLPAGRTRLERGLALGTGLVLFGGLVGWGAAAGAAPAPTVAQVQAKINRLTTQFDQVSQQLDQADEQLKTAQQQLRQTTARWTQARTQFKAAQGAMAQIAASAYENSGSTSIAGLLASDDPGVVLKQGSLLLQLSSQQDAQARQLLLTAAQLAGVKERMQRTENGVALLKQQLSSHKDQLGKLITAQQATLSSLTVQQQQQVKSGTIGQSGQSSVAPPPPPPPASLPTGTQAEKAVAFAYAQLGKPYQWGATGPGSYDCSGLVMAAWAAAGVNIPRDTYSQWAALPHIPLSQLEPGDLLYFDGIGHVAMYVGGGYAIDAPETGMDVRKLPISIGWYASNVVGAARP
jgi:cell wall-associated NlpC family hydrolase